MKSEALTYYKRYLEQAPNGSRAAIARRELKALAAASAETAASAPSSGLKAQPVSASTKSQTDATKPMRRPRATEGPAPASLRSPPESVPTPAKTEDTCRVDDVLCQYRRSQHGPATGEKK